MSITAITKALFTDKPITENEFRRLTCRWHLGRLRLDPYDEGDVTRRCRNERRRDRYEPKKLTTDGQ